MVPSFQKVRGGRSSRAAFLSLVFVLALLPGATTALAKTGEHQLPFKGTLQAAEVGIFDPGPPVTLAVTATGSGHATHLGLFAYSYHVLITFNFPFDFSGGGTIYYDLVAANGDHLYSVGEGFGVVAPGMPDFNHVVEQHVITGGTGRFAGASGRYTVDRLISHATGITSGTIDGYMVLAHDD